MIPEPEVFFACLPAAVTNSLYTAEKEVGSDDFQ